MEEVKAILALIPFWVYEKIKLRNSQGKSTLSHFSYAKRNELFYKKLEIKIMPILESKAYTRKKKRLFTRDNLDSISYVRFGLNQQLNGICVDYGILSKNQIAKHIKNGFDPFSSNNFTRLSPKFWEYDYQFPVYKSNKNDTLIIDEIKNLLTDNVN